MAVNLIALMSIVGGIFYLTEFRQNLIDRRMDQLRVQAEILAGAIGEAATAGPESSSINEPDARLIIARLVGPSEIRARLFGIEGQLMVDSRFLAGSQSVVAEILPPLGREKSLREKMLDQLNDLLDLVADRPMVPLYHESPTQQAGDYIEVLSAVRGTGSPDPGFRGRPLAVVCRISGAAVSPGSGGLDGLGRYQRYRKHRAVGTDHDPQGIRRLFGRHAFIVDLSASTIARPVRQLARAAERVRNGIGREKRLPRFDRNDEIGDLSLALSDMTEALYRQIDAIDSFAADVAHELKNPLSSLRSAAESLSRTDKPDIRERLLAIIAEDVRRLDRLITDISDASRLDADLTRSRMEPLDLGLLVAMLVDANRTREDCGQKTILFQEPKPGTMMVRGLESRLAQVIANLLENAISFSPDGGTIRLSLSRKGARLELLVEDEGPGLPEGAAQRIFERFYSERPEPEAFGTHSGLGLSISKQIVEAHKGQISASNRAASPDGDTDTPPSGARFCVSLPRL
ncbi:histidine kinase [Iodidimonas nitroreducens]|uniref:histidine kinase n=2 Tax=Iodidimonas nitroreducens TaxID=1236968 RepID=A0A5A7N5Q5_9PROT|nr:histidine kinase [Iodidimonas nitroreducens]